MALGGIDLNLLVILQALLEEGNVTRAGVRVGMPQPAMSNALARLRRHYHDELLLRTGNGYDLTPLAQSLLPAVRESTRLIGQALSAGQPGRPPAGHRVFTISLSDYSMTVLGKQLLRRVHELAPNACIQLRLATSEMMDDDRGLLGYDVLIAPAGFRADGQPEVIARDRLVYVADPANPRLRDGRGRFSAEDLAALPHAAARLPGSAADPVATALLRLGISPNVVMTTAGWLPLPFLIAGTEMVAAIPERLARRAAAAAGITVAEPPFGTVELVEAAWWNPMQAANPALSWLRGILRETAASLSLAPSLPGQRRPEDDASITL